jgi:hypothetical protein
MRTLMLMLALVSFAAAAEREMTAGDLYSLCNSSGNEQTACRFYILGAVQGIGLGDGSFMGRDGQFVERRKTIFCAPTNMSQSQMVGVFQKTMQLLERVFPQDLKEPAIALIAAAMHQKFPCQK